MTDAIDVVPAVLSDPTSVLFGLEAEFTVLKVERADPTTVTVTIEMTARDGPCPTCGVMSAVVKQRPMVRVKDLPASGQPVQVWWRKRRLACPQRLCPRRSFTQTSNAVRPRARISERLRHQLARSIAVSNRAVSDVAAEYGVSWPTAHQALIAAATTWLPAPAPTRWLGIDETRFNRVRWVRHDQGWTRTDPWLTSFVDCTPGRPGTILGLVPGRSGSGVGHWLDQQTSPFRDTVEIVVIDLATSYAGGITTALPHVKIAIDRWHLIALANAMITQARQRLTHDHLGRRGRAGDPSWTHRTLLLTGIEHLSVKQTERLTTMLATADPTGQIRAAWQIKEHLRTLLNQHEPSKIRWALADFYEAVADADLPEATRLARTVQKWWPAILVALTEQITNARTEGFNRIIKQVKRVGCGYQNMTNYQRRILTHIAVTRQRRSTA